MDTSSGVLNTAFYLPFGLRGTNEASATSALVQDLLCYDTVFVLADDMRAAGLLLAVMGRRALEIALSDGAIRLVRDRSHLVWPTPPLNSTLYPYVTITAFPGDSGERGAFIAPTGVLASASLAGFDLSPAENRGLSNLFRQTTLNLGKPPAWSGPPPFDSVEGDGVIGGVKEDLELLRRVVARTDAFALRVEDVDLMLHLYEAPLQKQRVDFNLFELMAQTGQALLDSKPSVEGKQLELLNFWLALRFAYAHRDVVPKGTLHSEPMVELALRASLAEGPRTAPGSEVDEVLEAVDVHLPTTTEPNSFPFEELLLERRRPEWEKFRAMVGKRDSLPDAPLVKYYIDESQGTLKRRLISATASLLVAKAIEAAVGTLPLLSDVAGGLIADRILARDGRYFIDKNLRRIAAEAHLTPGGSSPRRRPRGAVRG